MFREKLRRLKIPSKATILASCITFVKYEKLGRSIAIRINPNNRIPKNIHDPRSVSLSILGRDRTGVFIRVAIGAPYLEINFIAIW